MEPMTVYCIQIQKKKPFRHGHRTTSSHDQCMAFKKKQSGSSICSTERLRVYKAIPTSDHKKQKTGVGETSFQPYSLICSICLLKGVAVRALKPVAQIDSPINFSKIIRMGGGLVLRRP